MKNIKVGFENQQAIQQTAQQTNNKQITTNKNDNNDKNIIYLINKYKEQNDKTFFGKMRFLRTADYSKLNEVEIGKFKDEIIRGKYD